MRFFLIGAALPLASLLQAPVVQLRTPSRPVAHNRYHNVPQCRTASLKMNEADAAAPTAAAAQTTLPPDSFLALLDQAAESVAMAVADGNLLMEVEFPPVPVSKMDDSSLSAYDILAANLQFVVEFAKRLPMSAATGTPRKIALTLPDSAERQRAAKFYGDAEPWTGVSLWSLNGADKTEEEFSPMALFGSLFKQGKGAVTAAEWAEMYVVIGASAQELPAIQELAALAPTTPIVCFNLKCAGSPRVCPWVRTGGPRVAFARGYEQAALAFAGQSHRRVYAPAMRD